MQKAKPPGRRTQSSFGLADGNQARQGRYLKAANPRLSSSRSDIKDSQWGYLRTTRPAIVTELWLATHSGGDRTIGSNSGGWEGIGQRLAARPDQRLECPHTTSVATGLWLTTHSGNDRAISSNSGREGIGQRPAARPGSATGISRNTTQSSDRAMADNTLRAAIGTMAITLPVVPGA